MTVYGAIVREAAGPNAGPPGAPDRAEAQRVRVLEAAMLAIAERGVDALTIRDIAERAGMSPGHILYYFGRKGRILVATLAWSEDDLGNRRREALSRVRDPWRRIVRFVGLYLPEGPADPRWNLWAQITARPPAAPTSLDALRRMVEAWTADLEAVIGEGIRVRRFRRVDPAEAAARSCALMDGLAYGIVLGIPGRTRPRAIGVATRGLRLELRPRPGEISARRAARPRRS